MRIGMKATSGIAAAAILIGGAATIFGLGPAQAADSGRDKPALAAAAAPEVADHGEKAPHGEDIQIIDLDMGEDTGRSAKPADGEDDSTIEIDLTQFNLKKLPDFDQFKYTRDGPGGDVTVDLGDLGDTY